MLITSLLFEFITTPAGTATSEIVAWIVIFMLLLYIPPFGSDSSGARNDRAETGSAVSPGFNNGLVERDSLRRRKVHHSPDDAAPPGDSKEAIPRSRHLSSITFYYLKNLTVAYFLDVALFTFISVLMHQSILFIPTICANESSTDDPNCNYSFSFDREYFLKNPRTNDTLHMIYLKSHANEASRRRTLLFSHGNSGNLAHERFVRGYRKLASLGFDVYAWDYPSYGKSRLDSFGSLSVDLLNQDADFILHQVEVISNTPRSSVILWGFSMGGAISAELAHRHSSQFLVLQFPPDRFDWIVKAGTKFTGWFSSLPQFKVLNLFDLLPNISSPTCVFHMAAENDVYVTLERQIILFDQLSQNVKSCSIFKKVNVIGHNDDPFTDIGLSDELKEFIR